MASEIVEPEVERIKLSLAEENLIEQIHSYVSRLIPVVQEAKNVLEDLFNQRYEVAKVRSSKVQEDLKNIQDFRFSLVRYVAKISVSITHSSYYISIADTLTSLTSYIHNLVLDLELLSNARTALSEHLIISLQNVLEQVRVLIVHICNILKYLIESPSKISNYVSILHKEYNSLIQAFRDIYVEQELGNNSTPIAMFMRTLNLVIHSVNSLGEKAICLHILRTG